jgi:hypothetical protein
MLAGETQRGAAADELPIGMTSESPSVSTKPAKRARSAALAGS